MKSSSEAAICPHALGANEKHLFIQVSAVFTQSKRIEGVMNDMTHLCEPRFWDDHPLLPYTPRNLFDVGKDAWSVVERLRWAMEEYAPSPLFYFLDIHWATTDETCLWALRPRHHDLEERSFIPYVPTATRL